MEQLDRTGERSGEQRRARRRVTPPRVHVLAVVGGIVALAGGIAGWWHEGGPQSVGDIIVVLDLTIGGTVLVTGALVGRARAAEARRGAELAVLGAAAGRMSSSLTAEEIARAVVEETRRVVDYHHARVYVLEPGGSLAPIACEGRVGAYEDVDVGTLRVDPGQGFAGWCAEHRQPLLVPDANLDPRGMTLPGTADVDESMIAVPMVHKDELVGVITLSKLGLRQFDDEDLRLLMTLADQAATALAGARNVRETQRLTEELRLLLEMSSALSQTLDPHAVADLMARHLARAAGADEAQISDWDRAGDRLRTLGTFPAIRLADMDPYYPLAGFPATRAVLEDQRIAVVDRDDPEADPAEAAVLREEGMRGLVMLPLVVKGEAIGMVELTFLERPPDDAGRITLVRTMAHEAAMALENARHYEVARELADRDPLTGFHNHRSLHQRLAEEVARCGRTRRPLSVLMMDLDGFKTANDTYGHLYGDGVLAHVAGRIRAAVRLSDVPARFGGDEFAIVLPDTDAPGAAVVAQRILATLREAPYAPDDRKPYAVVGSIGVATWPRNGRTATDLIAAADVALYRAKAAGGNTVREAGAAEDGLPAAVGPQPGRPSRRPRRAVARLESVAGGGVG